MDLNVKIQDLDDFILASSFSKDAQACTAVDASGLVLTAELSSNETLHTFHLGEGSSWLSAAFTPDATRAAAGNDQGLMIAFDPWEGTPIFQYAFPKQWVQHLAWSKDGNYLAVAAGKTLKVFSKTGKELLHFDGHESSVSGISWGPGGLASACFTAVRYFSFPFQQAPKVFQWPISLVSVSFSPDGKFIGAGTQDSAIHFWPIPYSEGSDFEMSGYKGKAQLLQWSFDSQFLVTNCWNTVVCWSFKNGAPTGQQPIQLEARNERITALQISKDATFILTGDKSGLVDVFDYRTSPRPVLSIPLRSEISSIQLSGDLSTMLVGNKEGRLHIISDVPALIRSLAAK